MHFFDQPNWPQHCGHDIAVDPSKERVIQPTALEAQQGIEGVGITLGVCMQIKQSSGEPCRTKFLYTRYLYPGGWGPVHRIRDGSNMTSFLARLKQARDSDWVWGSSTVFPYKKCKRLVV